MRVHEMAEPYGRKTQRAPAVKDGAIPEALLALGARNVELLVTKNRLGATGVVPLRLMPAAGLAEERLRSE